MRTYINLRRFNYSNELDKWRNGAKVSKNILRNIYKRLFFRKKKEEESRVRAVALKLKLRNHVMVIFTIRQTNVINVINKAKAGIECFFMNNRGIICGSNTIYTKWIISKELNVIYTLCCIYFGNSIHGLIACVCVCVFGHGLQLANYITRYMRW